MAGCKLQVTREVTSAVVRRRSSVVHSPNISQKLDDLPKAWDNAAKAGDGFPFVVKYPRPCHTLEQIVNLETIQAYLQLNHLDGWLLYDFRGQNPIALHVAGIKDSGTRRWFLWIPAQGRPSWLIHAIERGAFMDVAPDMEGNKHIYIGWQQLAEILPTFVGSNGKRPLRIAMEYSPLGAVPYVSKVDAGTLELVTEVTGAEIVSSADLVQLMQAVLSPEQMDSHRRAAQVCLDTKDAAFAFVAESLRAGTEISEYDVQQFIMDRFAAANLDPDHPPIVAVNANAALPHYAPTAQRHSPIRRGDMLLIDLWAKEYAPDACFGDLTWTAYCGADVPATVQDIFNAVARARDTVIEAVEASLGEHRLIHGYELDDLARDVIREAGYGHGILHRTGHSLGPLVHWNGVNLDNLETQDRRRLIPGVMFTIEPGIYLPDLNWDDSATPKGLGIRTEVNCIVHADRLEVTPGRQREVIALLSERL
ncbi:M24 family metallopeptidase [bacterium]|nr:M24 family metallopeptidase [bacterium]